MESAPISQRSVHATGYVVLDLLVAGGKMTPIVGGTAANVAVNLSLLGWDSVVTALLGDDIAGREVVRQLDAYGVDTSGVTLDPAVRTPVLVHEISKQGRHRFRFSCPSCGNKFAKFRPLGSGQVPAAPRAAVHFMDRASSYALGLAEAVRDTGFVVFEPGTPGRPAVTKALASLSHMLRLSSSLDIEVGREEVAPQIQIVGLANEGVRFRLPGDPVWIHLPSELNGPLVDAGGAGDWLTTGTLDAMSLDGGPSLSSNSDSMHRAVSRGSAFAAACCAYEGTRGQIGSETWAELTRQTTIRRPVAPTLPRFEVANCQDCRAWFHEA